MKIDASKQLLLFTISIHVVYFVAAVFLKGIYLVDSYGYLMQAENIKTLGTWYAEDWNAPLLIDYFSIRPPLYAWVLIITGAIAGNIYVVLLVQNVLSIMNLWIVYRFVESRFGVTVWMQRFFVMGLLFYPAQMMHANFVMTEILFQTVMVLLFVSIWSLIEKPSWSNSIAIAVLLSLGLLTKPVSLFLLFVVIIIVLVTVQWRQHNIRYLLPFGMVVLVLHGICLQNEHATGCYHYTSIKAINQLKYNARYVLMDAKGEHYADSVVAECLARANAKNDYGERLDEMDMESIEIYKAYPASLLKIYNKGVVAFFLDPGRFDVYHFLAMEEKNTPGLLHEIQTKGISAISGFIQQAPVFILLVLLLNLCWNILVLGCFVYFLMSKFSPVKLRLGIFILVAYIATMTGPVGVSRYRVPVYPFLLMSGLIVCARKRQQNADATVA